MKNKNEEYKKVLYELLTDLDQGGMFSVRDAMKLWELYKLMEKDKVRIVEFEGEKDE